MIDVIDALFGHLEENWIKFITAGLLMGVGWVFGTWRAKTNWKNKEFYDRLNISLNVLDKGKLLIRTMIEKRCDDVFLNSVAVEKVTAAAHNTTEKDPTLPLGQDDYWYYLNAVLNEVAEKFADGNIKRDMGLPVTSRTYLICLTSEAAGAVRTRKVRAMLIQKTLLEKLPQEQPTFESPTHSTRWETLNILAQEYHKNPYKFLEMEICVSN